MLISALGRGPSPPHLIISKVIISLLISLIIISKGILREVSLGMMTLDGG